jgi:hypothetical protein
LKISISTKVFRNPPNITDDFFIRRWFLLEK